MHVAFFRNLNQGQRGHPRTADLTAAFDASAARTATAFQSNGTVVFEADDPDAVIAVVGGVLEARGLYADVIMTRPLTFIADIVQLHAWEPAAARCELTLFDAGERLAEGPALEVASARRRCEVIRHGAGWAVILNGADHQSNGTPTVEAITGGPATSRGMPTLRRLVERFGG